jgi:hypothetical protein
VAYGGRVFTITNINKKKIILFMKIGGNLSIAISYNEKKMRGILHRI